MGKTKRDEFACQENLVSRYASLRKMVLSHERIERRFSKEHENIPTKLLQF
jgi:hypothetical protein